MTGCSLGLICCAASAFAQEAPSGGGPKVNKTVFYSEWIKGTTTVTQVFGRSQNVTAVIVEFAREIASDKLTPDSFSVDDRTILSVKVTATPDVNASQGDGRFAVISLDPADTASVVYSSGVEEAPQVITRLTSPLLLVNGDLAQPGEKGILSTSVQNLVVDDFHQFRF